MKRFLIVSLLSLPLLLGTVPLAFAQTTTLTPDQQIQQAANQAAAENTAAIGGQGVQAPTPDFPTANNVTVTQPVIDKNGNVTNGATTEVTSTGNAVPANAAAPANGGTPSSSPSFTKDPIGYLMFQLVSMFAWLVGIGGLALNVSAYYSIVRMGYLVGQLSALQLAWSTFRDIGNLLILFGFIFFGISTMLDNAGYNQKKALVMLILVAIAINFSSLFARIIIDVGNVIGIQFYKAFNGGSIPTDLPTSNGIANVFMNSLKLTTIYNNPSYAAGTEIYIGFLAIILFIVVAFVFFSIAFIFIARFVVLVFLVTVSPLAFAALVIPKYEDQFKRWLGMLVNNTVVAPVMLLLLLVSTRIVTSPTFTNLIPGGDGASWGAFAGSPASSAALGGANLLVVFMLACAFYIASLIAAKQIGAFGASAATNFVGKTTFGTAGVAGRSSVGWVSYRGAKWLRSTSFARTGLGRMTVGALDKGAKASFDFRATTAYKKASKTTGIDAGEAQKGGYEKRVKESVEARTKYAKSLTGRGKTQEEKEAETQATANSKYADEQHKDAQKTSKDAKEQRELLKADIELRKAELDRIEHEEKNDKYWSTNPENIRRKEDAQNTLAASTAALKDADIAVAETNKKVLETKAHLDDRKAEEAKVKAAIAEGTSAKGAQIAYAENLENGMINKLASVIAFGPGPKEAADKIRKEAGKGPAEQELGKLLAAIEKEAKGGAAGEKKEEPPH